MWNQIPDGQPDDLVMLCASFNARMITRIITAHYTAHLAPSGLTPTQFSTLIALQTGGEMPITALTAILVTDRTTLARNLKPMERDGIIHLRRAEHDKRVHLVRISAEGQARLADALPLWDAAQASLHEQVGADLWEALTTIAQRLHP